MKSSEVELAINKFMASVNFKFGNTTIDNRIGADLMYRYNAFTDLYQEPRQTFKHFLGITFIDESNEKFANTLFYSFIKPDIHQTIFKTEFIVDNVETIINFLIYITPLVLQTIETITFCESITKNKALPNSFYRSNIINEFLEKNP